MADIRPLGVKVKNIGIEAWANRWGNIAYISFRLDFNSLNFAIKGGKLAEQYFKRSFKHRTFYNANKERWAKRKQFYPHPILEETGELKNSIKYNESTNIPFKKTVTVGTNEKYGNRSKKRNPSYAAVHNEAWQKTGYWSNQYHKSRPVQRQFMGHNSNLYKEINRRYADTLNQGLF